MSQTGADGWASGTFANPVIAGFHPDPSICQTVAVQAVPARQAVLRIEAHAAPPGMTHPRKEPDVLRLGVEEPDGTFRVLAELDGRYLSTEVAGGFTGRVIGMYAAAGTVRFDWFDYEPLGD